MRRLLLTNARLIACAGCVWIIAHLVACYCSGPTVLSEVWRFLSSIVGKGPGSRWWVVMLWLQMPYWLSAVISGVIIAFMYPRSCMRVAVSFSIAFVVFSVLGNYLIATQVGLNANSTILILDLLSMPLAVGAAAAGARCFGAAPGEQDNHPRCGGCAYDLTGLSSGICPECGTPISEEVKVALKQMEETAKQ
jgi:hypothetical protein